MRSSNYLVAVLRYNAWVDGADVNVSNWKEVIEDIAQHVEGVICPVEIQTAFPRHRKSKKPVEMVRPALLGYIAVSLGDWPLRKLIKHRGIRGVISGVDGPEFLLQDEVERLRRLTVRPEVLPPQDYEGKRVEIVLGPFFGRIGTYLRGHVSVNGVKIRALPSHLKLAS